MKRIISLLLCIFLTITMYAQEKLYIHKSDKITLGAPVSSTDSVYFSADGSITYFRIGGNLVQYTTAVVDSLTFGANSSEITVVYNGSSVSVVNPMAFEGVDVQVNGADVTVYSTNDVRDITYKLSGSTTDGMFKVYSAKRYNLVLNGVNITNLDGPAINLQSDKNVAVTITDGTTNTLADGSMYANATVTNGVEEDQNATFFSEGKLMFSGNGSLTIAGNGSKKHALSADAKIEISSGVVTVSNASKDGIHGKNGVEISGGTVKVTATADAIDGEVGNIVISGGSITTINETESARAFVCDSFITVSGGTIVSTLKGNQAKGFKSKQSMAFTGGNITLNLSGNVVLEALGSGYKPSYCTAIKCDSSILLNGSTITITNTGMGGLGISSDKNIDMKSGNVSISCSGTGTTYVDSTGATSTYFSSAINADNNVNILAGTLTLTTSGTGSKGISADGNVTIGDGSSSLVLTVNNTGTRYLISGTGAAASYCTPKAIKADGIMQINSGTITVTASQQSASALDCDSALTISGGTIVLTLAGNEAKAISSKLTMSLLGGDITVNQTGGVVLEASGSGYDASYAKAIKASADLVINGSKLTIISSGAAGKGIDVGTNLTMQSGNVNINCSGTGTTFTNSSATSDSYCAICVGVAGNASVLGGTLTTSASGAGGKGFSVDGTLIFGNLTSSPVVSITTTGAKFLVSGSASSGGGFGGGTSTANYCHPKAIRVSNAIYFNNGNISISSTDDGIHAEDSITQNGGTVLVSTSVEGVEAKFITINGGSMNVTASNDALNATAGLTVGGAETDDGSIVAIKGGTVVANCTNGDALDSNGSAVMTNGVLVLHGPTSSPEEAADFNNTFTYSGGMIIAAGSNSNMNKALSSSSTKYNIYALTSTAIGSSSFFHVQDASGNDLITYKPVRSNYSFIFGSTSFVKGSTYTIYTGGTYTGGTSSNGVYTGGTYANGTSKKSFTISSYVTSVTF